MNKKQIEVYERRGFENASFATGYTKKKAEACVKKIYKVYRKMLIENGYYGFGESQKIPASMETDEKINYVDLVKDVDLNDRRSIFLKELDMEELNFMGKYVIYGKHLLKEGQMDEKCVYTKETDAYKDLCRNIVGQEEMKETLCKLGSVFSYSRKRKMYNINTADIHKVFAFVGPPGTAKTTSARYFARMMNEEGVLDGYRIAYVTGTQLKAQYVGQTAAKVHDIFMDNDIIIIDEAYSLVNYNETSRTDSFSQEALAQLCIEVEDHSYDKLIIFAGYGGDVDDKQNKMKRFLDENPGISSRITFTVNFSSYNEQEMLDIFELLAKNASYRIEDGWREILRPFFAERINAPNFGNGREARRLLEHCMSIAAQRYIEWEMTNPEFASEGDREKEEKLRLTLLTCDDLRAAVKEFLYAEKVIRGREN
ncbi:MAG: AAA family ATPase [Clostridia bacterium]|nr:AAA family ATPase [Clostridia bacterium]